VKPPLNGKFNDGAIYIHTVIYDNEWIDEWTAQIFEKLLEWTTVLISTGLS